MPTLALPELDGPVTIVLDREDRLTDDEYFDFCMANRDLQIERTAEGDIVIAPPAGFESDNRSADIAGQLMVWSKATRKGKSSGSSAEFLLNDGSALSPDAAWTSNERLASVPADELRKFPRFAPEFVVEVMSHSDRSRAAQRKMQQWIDNGVELAWLIDGSHRCVSVYRSGRDVRKVCDVEQIEGEGPVEGFVLDLSDIWRGV